MFGQRKNDGALQVLTRSLLVVGCVASIGIGAQQVDASAAPLPAGVGDFVPTIDFGSALKDLVSLSNTPCKVTQSNVSELPTGDTLTLPATDLMKALAIGNAIKAKSDSLVTMSCTAGLSLSGTEKSISGTIANATLGLSGTFALKCQFKQNLKASADLSIGMALARGASLEVKSGDSTIPMTCAMSATLSDGTSMSGVVEGAAKVGTINSDACTGDTQRSCVPLSISATVAVTSTSGKLSGYVGSGTYDLKPSFTVPPLNENLGQFLSLLGKSSVRASSVRPGVAGNTGSMKINFTPGSARTEIIYPVVTATGTSTLSSGGYFAATGPRSTNCLFTVAKGKKSYVFAKVKSAKDGSTPTKTLTSAQYGAIKKQLVAKVGTALKMTVACGSAKASQSVTLG
jgi:hypothetical protein